MVISIASDHGGYLLKEDLVKYLEEKGHTVLNRGCDLLESVHYPEYAEKVALDVQNGKAERGILVCTSGIGMAISANKFKGIRAAVVRNVTEARLCREHNCTNVICFGAKFTPLSCAIDCLETYFQTEFGGGRHEIRVNMIRNQEEK